MSNDGWGKMPTNDDWSKPKVVNPFEFPSARGQAASGAIQTDGGWGVSTQDSWPKPAVSDGWGEFGSGTAWPENNLIKEVAPDYEAQLLAHQQREEQWTHDALEGAQNRAAVINSINERKDEYTIDRDGELSNINETVRAKRQSDETGWYLCYKEKWLHAIISGPYTTANEALLRSERAWSMFTEDAAFKLAFENKFNRDGLYCAEIPLSLKRKGAYGVLT